MRVCFVSLRVGTTVVDRRRMVHCQGGALIETKNSRCRSELVRVLQALDEQHGVVLAGW